MPALPLSKQELQPKLHDPGAASADRGDAGKVSGAGLIEKAILQHKIRMVEDVEDFPPELQPVMLGHGPILLQAQVDVRQSGRVDVVSPGIAVGERNKAVLIGRAVRAAGATR